ncbi:hypothetical protein QNI22_34910 [Cytophagaceae bacterium BD1B2-1]|uniref:Uncharacterized protein n=1 Tax=Xanthocytophaga agilis TaxID=3048010 RepID=A0AAE3R8N7_9BACT|nr:hypothetical protein [Xanthocytophaga agilis]
MLTHIRSTEMSIYIILLLGAWKSYQVYFYFVPEMSKNGHVFYRYYARRKGLA